MKNPITILLVEDNADHIADLKAMLDEELPRLPIAVNCLWAADLQGAMSLWGQFNPDAVMTDVFFPTAPGCPEDGKNGKFVVERCLLELKPVVWVTSTFHHGSRTEPLSRWGREHGLEMFDSETEDDSEAEAPHKPWKEALFGLFYTILALEMNVARFLNGKLVGKDGYSLKVSGLSIKYDYFGEPQKPFDLAKEPVMAKMVELGFPRT